MAHEPRRRSTAWRSVARAHRRGATDEEFMAPLPRDENWIADLGSDVANGGPTDAELGGPAPLTWLAVEEGLREQRVLIADLTARLDAVERSMADGSKGRDSGSVLASRLVSLGRSASRFVRWLTAKNVT